MTLTIFALRLLTALVLGTLIGVERQWHRRLADLKVTALVCIGSALFTAANGFFARQGEDPTRIAAQVVVGVGFLGAGLLWREGGQIRGITTAATLWCSAAVGVFVGVGATAQAVVATGLIVAGNTLLRPLGHMLNLRMGPDDTGRLFRRVSLIGTNGRTEDVERIVHSLMTDSGIDVMTRVDSTAADGDHVVEITLTLEGNGAEARLTRALEAFRALGLRRMVVEQQG